MSSQTVLLYSKYSPNSKRLMDLLNSVEVDIGRILNLQPLCIDNPKIRDRVTRSMTIEVRTVPCILVVYPDGGIEKFDGPHATQWVESKISSFAPPPPPQQVPPRQRSPQPKPIHVPADDDPPPEKPRRRHKPTGKRKVQFKPPKPSQSTSIDDLDSEDENEIDVVEQSPPERHAQRPPAGLRNHEGQFEIDDELFNDPQPESLRRAPIRAIKETTSSTLSGSTLISKAQEMQKAREREESTTQKPHEAGPSSIARGR